LVWGTANRRFSKRVVAACPPTTKGRHSGQSTIPLASLHSNKQQLNIALPTQGQTVKAESFLGARVGGTQKLSKKNAGDGEKPVDKRKLWASLDLQKETGR